MEAGAGSEIPGSGARGVVGDRPHVGKAAAQRAEPGDGAFRSELTLLAPASGENQEPISGNVHVVDGIESILGSGRAGNRAPGNPEGAAGDEVFGGSRKEEREGPFGLPHLWDHRGDFEVIEI